MTATRGSQERVRPPAWAVGAALLALLWAGQPALAQPAQAPASLSFGEELSAPVAPSATTPVALPPLQVPPTSVTPPPKQDQPPVADGSVKPASCSTCANGLLSPLLGPSAAIGGPIPDGGCGCGGCCVPGRKPCYPCCGDTTLGRFLCGIYECICCPDPCYEGRWTPIADSAFFVETARPVTQTRLRWDHGVNMILPDRAEYFWARADGQGKGPKPTGPYYITPGLSYNDLDLYTEAATKAISVFFEMPYRNVDPVAGNYAAGFGDMNMGLKTLLFDCELLQVSMIMRTFMPTGNFTKGIGVGHVSLEPSLVWGIKLTPETYLQGQVAEWIPIGGDMTYQGSILHYHFSLNQTLCRVLPDVPLIGTMEFNGWSFQDGAYTDPFLGPYQMAGGYTYASAGSGLRLFVCDRIDFGFAFALALTEQHFADQLYRGEFRFRY